MFSIGAFYRSGNLANRRIVPAVATGKIEGCNVRSEAAGAVSTLDSTMVDDDWLEVLSLSHLREDLDLLVLGLRLGEGQRQVKLLRLFLL